MTDVMYLATDDAAVSVTLVAIAIAIPLLLLAGLAFVAYTKRKARGREPRRPRD